MTGGFGTVVCVIFSTVGVDEVLVGGVHQVTEGLVLEVVGGVHQVTEGLGLEVGGGVHHQVDDDWVVGVGVVVGIDWVAVILVGGVVVGNVIGDDVVGFVGFGFHGVIQEGVDVFGFFVVTEGVHHDGVVGCVVGKVILPKMVVFKVKSGLYVVVGFGVVGVTTAATGTQKPPGRGGGIPTSRKTLFTARSSGIGSRQHLLLKSSKSIDQIIAPPSPCCLIYSAFLLTEPGSS